MQNSRIRFLDTLPIFTVRVTSQFANRLAHNFAAHRLSDGMDYSRSRQRKDGSYSFEVFPHQIPPAAAASEPVPPSSFCLLMVCSQLTRVVANAIVLVVSSHLLHQLPILFRHWEMAIALAPLPHRLDASSQPFGCCLSLDNPVALARLGPIMGKAQEVKLPIL